MRLLLLSLAVVVAGCATAGHDPSAVDASLPEPDAEPRPDARPPIDARQPADAPLPADAPPPADAPIVVDARAPDASLPDAGPTFPLDDDTVAAFELEADTDDSSGNGNDALYRGGTFVGGALEFLEDPSGFDWSAHAALLEHPFTVEMVLHTGNVGDYQKLFSFDDDADEGWYIHNGQFVTYLENETAVGAITVDDDHYLAFVSASAISMDVWIDGEKAGTAMPLTFTAPPAHAIFFRDDTISMRVEWLQGGVDAMRVSSKARTGPEIQAQWQRLKP